MRKYLPSVDGYGYHHAEYAHAGFWVVSPEDSTVGIGEDVMHVRNVY